MNLFNKLKDIADRNGDGKISKHDLEALSNSENNGIINKLKSKADMNDDGSINFKDIKDMFK